MHKLGVNSQRVLQVNSQAAMADGVWS